MYQYKVDIYKVKYAEDAMNAFAKEGWRVIAVTPDHQTGFVDVFYERKAKEETKDTVTEEAEPDITDIISEAAEDKENVRVEYAVRDDIWDFKGEDDTESEEEE